MTFFNLTSTEIMLLVLLAVVVLGPRRLPHYAARLADLVRKARDLAEGAKAQIKQEMGPAFEDVDWRQLDPRQYDPRRIVREALTESAPGERGPTTGGAGARGGATVAARTAAAGGTGRDAVGGATSSRPRTGGGGGTGTGVGRSFDPGRPVPFDPDAT
ncbi:Sec-independent protein translocase TatB [Ornithinimicrobium sp. W1665]|uniref:Sec-independent protein translocase TatB n=1 Tax=Ornithinimicrobium sp. W1665 TaxID=3416666 RepID=UPI003CF98C51